MLSDSPIVAYRGRSAALWAQEGGNAQTPFGWSLVSFGFALISLVATSLKPTDSASPMTTASVT